MQWKTFLRFLSVKSLERKARQPFRLERPRYYFDKIAFIFSIYREIKYQEFVVNLQTNKK
ncbi:MAG: hypothetical protein CVU08_11105 [Bacteroidetes bacterium HGW-Bacteroidetes-3]|nr:MAG: hypothetical protein CVU08_11105 [Bacteroidetes bacterium HGW-Bacteroidetes-3]